MKDEYKLRLTDFKPWRGLFDYADRTPPLGGASVYFRTMTLLFYNVAVFTVFGGLTANGLESFLK